MPPIKAYCLVVRSSNNQRSIAMGDFNNKHRDEKLRRSCQSRHNDKRPSHKTTVAEKNAAAIRRTIRIETGPFTVELSPFGASVLRPPSKEDEKLGRKPATIWIDYDKVLEIDHTKIPNPKTKKIVLLWKMGAGIPIPFHTTRLLSPDEARDQDRLWEIAFHSLPVTGEKVCTDLQ